MTFEEYLKLAGSISRADAVRFFYVSHDELAERSAPGGDLIRTPDALTPFADRFTLADPESIYASDFSQYQVELRGAAYRVALDTVTLGLWRLSAPGRPDRQMSSLQLIRTLGMKDW